MSASMPESWSAGLARPAKNLTDGRSGISNRNSPGFRASAFVESERTRELDRRAQFYACTQHNWKQYDFDGRATPTTPQRPYTQPLITAEQAPYYVPLRLRRPSAPYRLARVIVRSFTTLLFGEQRWPSIKGVGDEDSTDFAEALCKESGLSTKFIQARNIGGSCGTVGLSWCYHEGKPRVNVHEGKHCHVHKWADREELIPAWVSEIYRYPLDEWDEQKNAVVRNWYWSRHDWTEDADVCFLPVRLDTKNGRTQEPEWIVDQANSVQHDDDECHFVWIQNIRTNEVDGLPDYDGLYENFDTIDVLNSVLARAVTLNCDPTLVLKMDLDLVQRMGVKKGSDNALTVGKDGDARYMEMSGSGIDKGMAYLEKERVHALEVAECVITDPNTLAANGVSAVAIKMIYAKMIQRCEELREQYGAAIKRLICQMMKVAREKGSETIIAMNDNGEEESAQYVVALPPKVVSEPVMGDDGKPTGEESTQLVDRQPGQATTFDLTWGPWFAATPTDQTSIVTALSGATGMKPFMSEETAIELMAASFSRDPAEEKKRLLGDKKAAQEQNSAMFGDESGATGGQVQDPNELPPGAEPAPAGKVGDRLDGLTLTSSDMASVVSVNEFRTLKLGLTKLMKDGKDDPDGELTIPEFKAKHAAVLAAAAQADKGTAPGVTHEEPEAGEPLLSKKAGPPPPQFPPGMPKPGMPGQPMPGQPGKPGQPPPQTGLPSVLKKPKPGEEEP